MELPLSKLKLADGKGVKLCRVCGRNEEVEDYNHWMLRSPRWGLERRQSCAITGLVCEDREIVPLIHILNVDCKIQLISLIVSVDYVYGVHLYV